MMHGPCGVNNRKSPCMTTGKCSKYFPKKLQEKTIVDQDDILYTEEESMATPLRKVVSRWITDMLSLTMLFC
jgi:hypothetical protein